MNIRSSVATIVALCALVVASCRDNPVHHDTASITGHVTDAVTGAPVASANVQLDGAAPGVTTDSHGAYTITPVSAGTHTVTASHAGYSPASGTTTVAAGGSSTLDLVLHPESDGGRGNVLPFDGGDDYGLLNSMQSLNLGSGSITVEGWVRPESFGSWNWLLSKATSNYAVEFIFGIDRSRLSFNVNGQNETDKFYTVFGRTTLATGSWFHMAAVYDRTAGTVRVYLNGVLDGERTIGSVTPVSTESPVFMGAREYFGTRTPAEYFHGAIADVRLWNVARTQAQIAGAMHTRLHGDEGGLVAYWKLDEGGGSLGHDATGHGLDMPLFGSPIWGTADLPVH
ncbi:MAG: carboxypeptidase regulatory-like domain-containing protein [Bacteroidetes bacterium]|nr:carboxypeptidase regulatory-like domain-containing protein [Bacteroidota bacterium]